MKQDSGDTIAAGNVLRAPYPFIRTKYQGVDADGHFETETWAPGVKFRNTYNGDSECIANIANGAGEIVLTVISVHKPGRYPTRVFFTRRWSDPDGGEFGKPRCLCATMEKFRRIARGYRFAYEIEASPPPQPEAER